jgi:hypothetical protein
VVGDEHVARGRSDERRRSLIARSQVSPLVYQSRTGRFYSADVEAFSGWVWCSGYLVVQSAPSAAAAGTSIKETGAREYWLLIPRLPSERLIRTDSPMRMCLRKQLLLDKGVWAGS